MRKFLLTVLLFLTTSAIAIDPQPGVNFKQTKEVIGS